MQLTIISCLQQHQEQVYGNTVRAPGLRYAILNMFLITAAIAIECAPGKVCGTCKTLFQYSGFSSMTGEKTTNIN